MIRALRSTTKARRTLTLGVAAVLVAGSLAAHAAATRPSFTLSSSASPLSVTAGQQKQYKIKVKRQRNLRGPISLTVKKLPRGASARWTLPNGRKLRRGRKGARILASGSSRAVLTIKTGAATPVGKFRPRIDARSGRIRRTRKIKLEVRPPAQQSLALYVGPATRDLLQGDRASYDLAVVRGGGLAGVVDLSVAGLPRDVSASFSPSAGSDAASATLTLEAGRGAPPGSYGLTITGAAGGLTASGYATLVVKETRPFGIAGELAEPLTPGSRYPLDLTLTNPHDFDLEVTALSVALTTNQPGCPAENFAVAQIPAVALPLRTPPGTRSLSQLGLAPTQLPQLAMLNLAANQDACSGARLDLRYAGFASRG